MSVHVLRLRAHLSARGFRVRTLAAGRSLPRETHPDAFLGNSPWRHARAGRQFDGVVHVHHRIGLLTSILCSRARRGGHPLVLTIHGEPRNMFTRRPGPDRFLLAAVRAADRVVAVNDHVLEALRSHVPLRDALVLPAYLPPTPDEVARAAPEVRRWLDAGEQPVVSMTVYRVLPPPYDHRDIYGLSVVSAALERLPPPALRLRLAILLSMKPTHREQAYLDEQLRLLRSSLGENAVAVFTGVGAPSVVVRSAAFLRPTLCDGDSLTVREALELGVPVVASDAVRRPAGAALFRSGDAEDLSRALREVLERGGAPRVTPGPRASRAHHSIERIYDGLPAPVARRAGSGWPRRLTSRSTAR
jgi:glycosyltransferase involved in cell wall biosynthesis